MALTTKDGFRAVRMIGGGTVPTFKVVKATGTTWSKGEVVVHASGLATGCTDEPGVATVLGVAAEDAISGKLTALIWPALPNIVFWGRVATGDSGATAPTAEANRYLSGTGAGYEISYDTVHYINLGENTTSQVMITDFIDTVGTAWGAVEFVFTASAFNSLS
jgi:hypothetical protein